MTKGKKARLLYLVPGLICLTGSIWVSFFWMYEYKEASFEQLSKFCEILLENNPEARGQVLAAVKEYYIASEQEMKGKYFPENTFLSQYGYRSSEFCRGTELTFLIPMAAVCLAALGSLVGAWVYDRKRCKKRIRELTEYLEQVNGASGGLLPLGEEDEFSGLWDEMYKTVTELYQTREEAVEARQNFADNLANIAHQLKTPVAAASLSLQLLEKEASGVRTERMKRQLKRLETLEEALLKLSKLDTGALQLEKKTIDIYTALELAAENLSELCAEKEAAVFIPDRGCIGITGDLDWTMEALMNLIKNCIEHSPRGGTVSCDYSENPLYVQIRIWDQGEGFCPEDIPHLFERFYRGSRAAGNGVGIGLALAQAVFREQNGTITARNLPEGGACFEIRIYSH